MTSQPPAILRLLQHRHHKRFPRAVRALELKLAFTPDKRLDLLPVERIRDIFDCALERHGLFAQVSFLCSHPFATDLRAPCL
eukprot:3379951-Rhodomonas_salina.1